MLLGLILLLSAWSHWRDWRDQRANEAAALENLLEEEDFWEYLLEEHFSQEQVAIDISTKHLGPSPR